MTEVIIDYLKTEMLMEKQISVSEKENLLDNGVVDSLGMMRLILYLEKKTKKRVPPEDMTLDNFQTIEKIANYFSV